MRALGPGSVSSLLKMALDVAYWVLWLAVAALVVAFVASFFIPLEDFDITFDDVEGPIDPAHIRGVVGYVLAFAGVYIGALILILSRLRQVFRDLAAGQPFVEDNVRRLRQIGFVLAGVVGLQIVFGPVLSMIVPQSDVSIDIGGLVVPVFSVLVVFVLSEVFREGARLRREQELTI